MQKTLSRVALLVLFATAIAVISLVQLSRGPFRIDLTADRLFTLSSGTLSTLQNLEHDVQLELFFTDEATRDIPVLRNHKRRVTELLEEYVLLSDGKLTLTETDPKPFSEAEDRAARLGLTPAALAPGAPAVYFGLAATGARGQPERVSFFQPGDDTRLEQTISKAVFLAGRAAAPKVAVISTLDIDGGFDPLAGRPTDPWFSIQQVRDIADVSWLPRDVTAVPEDVSVLLVIHPNQLSDATRYAIDQHVMRGGNVAVFLDPLAENLSANGAPAEAGTTASDLPALLAAWGVELVDGKVVGDARFAVAIPSRQGNQPVRHLGLYQLQQPTTDKPIVGGLELFTLASAGALRQTEHAPTQFTPLLQSSRNSALLDAEDLAFLFDPATLYDGFAPTGEQFTLAALLRGRPPTAFPSGAPTAPAEGDTAPPHRDVAQRDALIVVVADTDLLLDQMWVQVQDFFGQRVAEPFADNGTFLLNTVDTLLGNADLIGLRARGQHQRPFHVVQQLEREADARFRAKERELTARLTDTETRLAELQRAKTGDDALVLSAEQNATIAEFEAEKLSIRKALRAVQLQLREDIDALENRLKLINIVVAPALLTLLIFVWVQVRRRLRRAPF
ncbi:MAG: Gldg family protein [Pseudomonadota bacterium]